MATLLGLLALPFTGAAVPAAGASTSTPGVNLADCPGGALVAHAPIAIVTDADWTAANGISKGSGTPSDPFVISCLSIQVPASGIGISIAPVTMTFTIRDVQINLPAGASGVRVQQARPGSVVDHNSISGGALCMSINASSTLTVTANMCSGSAGDGFDFTGGQVTLTGNDAEHNKGNGFSLSSGMVARNNTSNANNDGFLLSGTQTVDSNTITNNHANGIDMSAADASLITNNTITGNGSAGITADPSQTQGFFGWASQVSGNHIGGNPYGIVFVGIATGNQVWQTDWTDGQQSIVDSQSQNAIIDAGSNKLAASGAQVNFADYVARLAVGNGSAPPVPTSSLGQFGALANLQMAVETGIKWDFGDGTTSPSVANPAQGVGPVPLFSHTYTYTGPGLHTFTATLIVDGTNSANQPVELTDTVGVTIQGILPPPPVATPGSAGPVAGAPWSSFGDLPGRTFYNGAEQQITKNTVTQLVPKWRYPTNFPVTASPAIAQVGSTKVAFDGAFDGTFFAVKADTGLPLWTTCLAALSHLPAPGTPSTPAPAPAPVCSPPVPFPTQISPQGDPDSPTDYGVIVASPAVATVTTATGGSEQRVFDGANATMFGLDAATGAVRWQFVAGSTDPTYDIESSPLVVGNQVIFGIDCNQHCPKGGGLYSVDAGDGHLNWFFDTVSGTSYVPPDKTTFSYDPTFHPSQPGGTCGGIWGSPSVDLSLGLVYADTSNCDQSVTSPYFEAIFALHLADGTPAWSFTPRQIDGRDMDFGATPNVFTLASGRHLVGAGGKDGVYYMTDAVTGALLWSKKLTLGGSLGGFFNGATDGNLIYLTAALGDPPPTNTTVDDTRSGREFAIDANTGNEVWRQVIGGPNFGQDSLIPGLYLTSGLDHLVHAFDATNGNPLWAFPLGGAAASTPVVSGGEMFLGIGTGATYRSEFVNNGDPLGLGPSGLVPSPLALTEPGQGVWAFCLATDPTCATHGVTG